ncbi:MAG TPA: hypothetical protein VEB22_15405 [Phycisphaerales bacterium]|nr:hypothetical protein [Phycisphaerales bacterium]
MSAPGLHNPLVVPLAGWYESFRYLDGERDPIDLAGVTFDGSTVVDADAEELFSLVEYLSVDDTDPDNPLIVVDVPDSVTESLTGSPEYAIWLNWPSGRRDPLLKGVLVLDPTPRGA